MAKRQHRNLSIKALAQDFVRENVPVPEFFEKIAEAMEAEMERMDETGDGTQEEVDALSNDSTLLRKLAKEYERKFS